MNLNTTVGPVLGRSEVLVNFDASNSVCCSSIVDDLVIALTNVAVRSGV